MLEMNRAIKIFTGSEIMISMIKGELENHGIASLIKSDFNSGVTAGFSEGVPSAIDLYIEPKKVEEARQLIDDLINDME